MSVTGVVVGKFLPFHRGHRRLVETAAAACDDLFVLVLGRTDEEPIVPLATRVGWIDELVGAPHVHVRARIVDAPMSWTDPVVIATWNGVIAQMVGRPIDVLFTGERDTYGDVTAAGLDARHVCVDPDRSVVPISGTVIRRDPFGAWGYLDPPVRAFYAGRVRVVGGESTGKTTLADLVARRFTTTWVPEWGRAYSDPKDARGEPWSTEDFVAIASEQARLEDIAARRADRVLVCDTDPLTTGIWHRVYLGTRAPDVDAIGAQRRYALTLLAGTDIAWKQDGDRNSDAERRRQQAELVERLVETGATVTVVSGSRRERVAAATAAIADRLGIDPPDEGTGWVDDGIACRWRHLVPRPASRRRSLFVAGTDLTATDVTAELIRLRTDHETLAARLGVPASAVLEADWYAARHVSLAYAEARGDIERIAVHADTATRP